MKTLLLLPLAFIAGFIAFPIRVIREQPLPDLPTPERLMEDMEPGDWYKRPFHYLKNVLTELFRADPRWWAQCSCFVIASLAITVCVQLIVPF